MGGKSVPHDTPAHPHSIGNFNFRKFWPASQVPNVIAYPVPRSRAEIREYCRRVTNPKLKADMSGQAQAYRKLAAERAEKLGLPHQARQKSKLKPTLPGIIERKNEGRDDGKQHQALDSGEDRIELHAAGRSHISLAAALNAQGGDQGPA